MRKLVDQPLPFLIAVALTTASLAFAVMDAVDALTDTAPSMAVAPRPTASFAAGSSLAAPRLP